jgi:hypothetical protein
MHKEPTRKPRPKPGPYIRKPKISKARDTPKTSAQLPMTSRKSNLTLADWMQVFDFVDQHPHMGQIEIVKYFETKHDGALVFSQSTLSRKLDRRQELADRVESNPNALSSRWPCVVTRPDVERALVLWISHMDERGETVTGPMLQEKWRRFEHLFDIPEEQQLTGDGWLASFKKTYKLKEYQRHGEAGSVDLIAVEAEQRRVQELMKLYAPRDRWNFDETSSFPMYVKSRLIES